MNQFYCDFDGWDELDEVRLKKWSGAVDDVDALVAGAAL